MDVPAILSGPPNTCSQVSGRGRKGNSPFDPEAKDTLPLDPGGVAAGAVVAVGRGVGVSGSSVGVALRVDVVVGSDSEQAVKMKHAAKISRVNLSALLMMISFISCLILQRKVGSKPLG
jgi:hypothetical protein